MKIIHKIFWVLAGIAVAYSYLWIFLNFPKIQRDFPVYWSASRAFGEGLNPYLLDNLSKVYGQLMNLPYTYTPLPLFIFYPLSVLPYAVASVAFFVLKCAACLYLFRQWLSRWVERDRIFFVIFALAAYNRAIWGDLVAGNVVVFEQILLWASFWCFLKKRWAFFSLGIALASVFKIVPILWLGLLIFSADRRAYIYGLTAGVSAISLQWLSFAVSGFQVHEWLGSILWNHGGGRGNPCLHAFLKDLQQFFGLPYEKWFFFLLAACIALVTVWALMRLKGSWEDRAIHILLFCCFAYSFVLSEFKGYSYILLILPTWFVWTRTMQKDPLWLVIAFLVLETFVPMEAWYSTGVFWNYSPLFIALFMWARHLRYLCRV